MRVDDGEAGGNDWAGTGEGKRMVLIKKEVKARGRVDGVFADVMNARSTTPTPGLESGRESRQEDNEGKDKWWNLTRGRKDTGGKDGGMLGFMRRGKCECFDLYFRLGTDFEDAAPGPGPSLPPTPPLEFQQTTYTRVHQPHQEAPMQMHLPGEPD